MIRVALQNIRPPLTYISYQCQNLSRNTLHVSAVKRCTVPAFRRAEQFPSNIALNDQHGDHTYGDISKLSGSLANILQDVLGPGLVQQRVAFLCPNDVSYVITQWATWMAGHVAVPLCPKHPSPQLEYVVRDSQASLIVTTSELSTKIKPILSGQQVVVLEEHFFKPSNKEDSDTSNPPSVVEEEASSPHYGQENEFYSVSDAMILYTSGTTGPPKGVVLSHKNVLSQVSCLLKSWGWTSGDCILHCLPLHHTHGIINALLCPLYVGARVIMLPEFSASKVWTHLLSLDVPVESRVNMFMAVPTIYAKLIEEYENKLVKNERIQEYVKSVCMQNVRLMVCGSAALPVPILERWKDITGHTLLERYGMTEIGMALSNPLKGHRKPGFVGNPLPNVEVRIAKFHPGSEEYEVLCSGNSHGTNVYTEGEAGELLISGPNVFKEYWNKPEETRKEFTHDKWFKTGDTAQYIDGTYKILGRTSVDIIKSGGFKISALDVERYLLDHPDIAELAVVGLPDITWGQKVAALIVWEGKEPLDLVKLRDWARERMPHYQVPTVVRAISEPLPRNNMGKVNKKQIVKDFFPESGSQQ